MVPINYIAVVVAAIVAFGIGGLWYGPLFGKKWMELSGFNPASMKPGSARTSYAISFVGSLVMSFVLSHALVFASAYLNVSGISAGLQAGFWNWLGFIVPVSLGTVLWDGKPWTLWFVNAGYYLVSLLVIGVILALWI